MPNIRIVYDNAADRAALSASSTAGSLVAANLLTNVKSQPWRSTSRSATLTLTWSDPEIVGCVALPFCSLTSTATIRVRGYANAADAEPVIDTGIQLACAYTPLGLWSWGLQALGVNAYSYGGGTYARAWLAQTWVRKLVIDIVDDDNPNDYIEAARLVVGGYWTPEYNFEWGATISTIDSSHQFRTDAGDLVADESTRTRELSLDFKHMTPADRQRFQEILRGNGLTRPMFVSPYPEAADLTQEQEYQVYGNFTVQSAVTVLSYGRFGAPMKMQEI